MSRNTDDSRTTLAQRYYSFGGRTVGHRDGAGSAALTNVTTDGQGTPSYAYKNATGSFVAYRKTPFGGTRGSDLLPGQRRFVGGTVDAATSLIQIGTRPYDPAQGRFLTSDPLIDTEDPAQVASAYSYAHNDPITLSDPSGEITRCSDCTPGVDTPRAGEDPYTGGTPTGGYDEDYQEDHPVDQTDNNTPEVGDGNQQSQAGSGVSTAVGVAGDVASGASGAYLANIANQASTASAAHLRYAEELRLMARRSQSPPRSSQLASASGKAASYADDFKALSGTAKFGSKLIPGLGVGLTAVSEFSDPADRSTKERVANAALISGAGLAVGAVGAAVCVGTVVCGGAVLLAAGVSWGVGKALHSNNGWLSSSRDEQLGYMFGNQGNPGGGFMP